MRSILFVLFYVSLSVIAEEHSLLKDFNLLTSNCEKKNINGWLEELSKLENKLYEQSYGMNKDEFHRTFLSHDKDPDGKLFWLYTLYGKPYIPPHGNGGCWIYFYEFKESMAKDKGTFADKDTINNWEACVWDSERKSQPMAEVFLACYKKIPKD